MEEKVVDDTFCQINGRITVIIGSLGHAYKGEYLIEPDCLESVKDLIRLLKKDDKYHIGRRCLGKINIIKYHLINIIKNCSTDMIDLFNITLRLLINLTTPPLLLYNEEIPQDKSERHIYITLLDYDQRYKTSFGDVEFWNKICSRMTNLFEIEWTKRSADDEIEIERIFTLLRNVLYISAYIEDENKPYNDLSNHDKIIEALRHSHVLELLLVISSDENEESYYLNLLEIFSFLLRDQNPKVLACTDVDKSEEEKMKDLNAVVRSKEIQNNIRRSQSNCRYFNSSFVMKGVKSVSNIDIVCHKSLEKLKNLNICQSQKRPIKSKIVTETFNKERRSTFSFRLFLKEFCTEFLNNSFSNLMNVVKNKLDSGKTLPHDQTYYFWALSFFLKFAIEAKVDINLIKNCLILDSFHFIQTNMDVAFDYLLTDKKKIINWVKRIHIILKAYKSLLETLLFMDNSENPLIRALSRELKSEIFYVVEYREMTLQLLLKYDSNKFPLSYIQDLIQTVHLFLKLLEEFSKQKKLVVQKVIKKRKKIKDKSRSQTQDENVLEIQETKKKKWKKIKDSIYDIIVSSTSFPEIPPFDATVDIALDEQKKEAMKNIQKYLLDDKIEQSIGLLRSSREVWPENNYFGFDGMTAEDEVILLQEIYLAELGPSNESTKEKQNFITNEEEEEEEEDDNFESEHEENFSKFIEQDFDLLDYKKRFVHKKVVESCGILLKYYKKNSSYINHCALKLLHRISWECCMPAMLYQASLFWTLLGIINDSNIQNKEINIFTINLLRKFQNDAQKNKIIFLELLFWKDHNTAVEIQNGYGSYNVEKSTKLSKVRKLKNSIDNFNVNFEMTEKKSKVNQKNKVRKNRIKNAKNFKKVEKGSERIIKLKKKNKKDILFTKENGDNILPRKKNREHNCSKNLKDVDYSDSQSLNHSFKKRIKSKVLTESSEEEEINKSTVVIENNVKNNTNLSQETFAKYDAEITEKYKFQKFDSLKGKRQRFIDSDSDNEEFVVSKNYRKKKAIIDSESDADDFESDSKNE